MPQVGTFEAKTHLSRLLEQVERGEEITITKRGVPIAILAPVAGKRPRDPAAAIAALKIFRRGHRLAGITGRELFNEGQL